MAEEEPRITVLDEEQDTPEREESSPVEEELSASTTKISLREEPETADASFYPIQQRINVNLQKGPEGPIIMIHHLDGKNPLEVYQSRRTELGKIRSLLSEIHGIQELVDALIEGIDEKLAVTSDHSTFEDDTGYISARLIRDLQAVVHYWQNWESDCKTTRESFGILYHDEAENIANDFRRDLKERQRMERQMQERMPMPRQPGPFQGFMPFEGRSGADTTQSRPSHTVPKIRGLKQSGRAQAPQMRAPSVSLASQSVRQVPARPTKTPLTAAKRMQPTVVRPQRNVRVENVD